MNLNPSFKYGLSGKFRAKKGNADELAAILLKAAQTLSDASGAILYIVSRDAVDPRVIWVNEIWETREDHDNSLHIEEVQQLISEALPLIEGKPEQGAQLQVLGGLGLPLH